jgi:hypothetical protein
VQDDLYSEPGPEHAENAAENLRDDMPTPARILRASIMAMRFSSITAPNMRMTISVRAGARVRQVERSPRREIIDGQSGVIGHASLPETVHHHLNEASWVSTAPAHG